MLQAEALSTASPEDQEDQQASQLNCRLSPALLDEVKVVLLLACRVSRVREIFSAVTITSFSKPSAGTPSQKALAQQHLSGKK